MADASDVANTLATLIAGIVYPNGTSQPSIVGTTVGIERGWPIPTELQSQLDNNQCIVSIFAPPGMERNTTRYPREAQVSAPPVHTLTATVVGNTITIGGTVSVPQNVVVSFGMNTAFPYSVQTGDTLSSIARTLAAYIAVEYPGTVSNGDVIAVAGEFAGLQAWVAGVAATWTEQKRQEKVFWITCWCPFPAIRDSLASDIDAALAQLEFITLPDNSAGRIIYNSSRESDEGEKNEIYRRDLLYSVEYATASIGVGFEIGAVLVNGAVPSPPSVGELDFSTPANLVLDASL